MSLAQTVRKVRMERGMTQPQLAELLHVTQATISMFESGELDAITDDLKKRIQAWIDSGRGAPQKSKRGPYKKARATIAKK